MGNSIKQQLKWASGILESITCSARLDSEILLAYCLQKERSYLMTWPEMELTQQQLECFKELIRKRLQPQPVAYLTGEKEFYSLTLKTTAATLVPRPETEMLVDKVLELIGNIAEPEILELGTGTGAIALSIKQHSPESKILATDISQATLEVAMENAQRHHLNIEFTLSDWFKGLDQYRRFDVIVSNPPYIANHDPYLSQGDLPAEPRLALTSGDDGMHALTRIITSADLFLKPGGWLVLEHGYDQQQSVNNLLQNQGYVQVKTLVDFNQLPRMSVAQKPLALLTS
jgi:release factor glutamine methyltransferase